MFDIDLILKKADLLEYVRRAGGELRGGGNRYSCACPLHGGDNKTAFSVYFQDGRWKWNCFTGNCGGGDAITFVEVWQGFSDLVERNGRRVSTFQQACEWINGGAIEDAEGMRESAARRHEEAKRELEAAKEREQARRNELRNSEIHLRYHQNMKQYMRDEWTKAGIDEGMQSFWTLGGCDDFVYKHDEKLMHSPTLTIPVFNPQRELMTIQHRLLNPADPNDKYRPEKSGLHSHPFLALPELGYDGDVIWVMEGAKKAMVTWTKADMDWQCIGLPSQESYKGMIETLSSIGDKVVVVPDPNSARNPNSLKKAYHLAKNIGGRFLQLSYKIDDYINATDITKDDLHHLFLSSRRV